MAGFIAYVLMAQPALEERRRLRVCLKSRVQVLLPNQQHGWPIPLQSYTGSIRESDEFQSQKVLESPVSSDPAETIA
eukprot:scaffold1582_cov318-Pavlova_lutheri.AAC.2